MGIFSLPFCDWYPLWVYSLSLNNRGRQVLPAAFTRGLVPCRPPLPGSASSGGRVGAGGARLYPKWGPITGDRRAYTPSGVQSQEAGEHIPQMGVQSREGAGAPLGGGAHDDGLFGAPVVRVLVRVLLLQQSDANVPHIGNTGQPRCDTNVTPVSQGVTQM
eukprot:1189238-Prorocentrum_minimum.AAC.2